MTSPRFISVLWQKQHNIFFFLSLFLCFHSAQRAMQLTVLLQQLVSGGVSRLANENAWILRWSHEGDVAIGAHSHVMLLLIKEPLHKPEEMMVFT